ncbi:hypothetical protein SNE40_012904 [Patella caerulea]|uniref:Uncharacterized protein n=1 Tax=Patella caerulea TaxID=87958 RepID=A0AAN8JL57_PATCE
MGEQGVELTPVYYKLDGYTPPKDCGDERCRDFFMEFIYFCVIPTSVLFLFTFILGICFCCSKSSRKPKEDLDDQMRYDTIRRASRALRRMSYTRDTPLLEDQGNTMTLDRTDRARHGFRSRDSCHSAPGTLQRHKNRHSAAYYSSQQSLPPPPAYRLPPQYPDDDVFIQGNNIPMDEFSANLRRQLELANRNNGFVSQ